MSVQSDWLSWPNFGRGAESQTLQPLATDIRTTNGLKDHGSTGCKPTVILKRDASALILIGCLIVPGFVTMLSNFRKLHERVFDSKKVKGK